LRHKGSLLRLLDLKPEKELQFSHHRHLKFFAHILYKARNQRVRLATKDNITHGHLNNEDIITLPEEKKSLINLAHNKPLAEQEPPQTATSSTGILF
jgi:hypothetical protein